MSTQRIDYYDSPEAPRANSLVPAVNVVAVNHAGAILLIRRTDNGNWALPGGGIDLGESVAQAAVRETLEESGIECVITGIVGIYSDPKHVIFYTSNGEARQESPSSLPPGSWADSRRRAASQARSAGSRNPNSLATRWTGRCAPASTTSWHATSPR